MKRCIIDLPKFRVSAPGHDVDTAAPENMVFHEDFLFTQPYFFGWVACPFASYVGGSEKDQTATVTVPDVTDDPVVILYAANSASANVFPTVRSKGAFSSTYYTDVDNWTVSHKVLSSTSISVRFYKPAGGDKSPAGAYLILMGRP